MLFPRLSRSVLCVFVLLASVGCPKSTADKIEEAAEEVKDETKDAAEEVKDEIDDATE